MKTKIIIMTDINTLIIRIVCTGFFITLVQIDITAIPEVLPEFSGFERSFFFSSCQFVKMNPNVKIQLSYWTVNIQIWSHLCALT